MERDFKTGRREATLIMSRRLSVSLTEIGSVMSSAFGEVYGHLDAHGIEPQGPPFVIYWSMPESGRPLDLEICAPIGRSVDPPEGWRVRELPAGEFATLMHVGPYDTLGESYEALTTWIGEQGLVGAGPPREVYLSPPDTPPAQVRTIVEFPVAHTGVPALTI